MEKLQSLVKERAAQVLRPDGTACSCLSYSDELEIAKLCGCSLKDVQLASLASEIIPTRYIRNQRTISTEDQISLLKSHVAIVGLGGLGGYVVESLARLGVGRLSLIDGDCFDESNLNRQLLSSVESLGVMKAVVAADRVKMINPAVETQATTKFFTSENGQDLLAGADLVIDCLDNISSRFELEDSAKVLGIPMVFAAIGGVAGQVMTIFPEDDGLVKIYGDRKQATNKGSETTSGTIGFAAMATAAHECAEAVALVLKRSPELRNTLLFADICEHSAEKIQMG